MGHSPHFSRRGAELLGDRSAGLVGRGAGAFGFGVPRVGGFVGDDALVVVVLVVDRLIQLVGAAVGVLGGEVGFFLCEAVIEVLAFAGFAFGVAELVGLGPVLGWVHALLERIKAEVVFVEVFEIIGHGCSSPLDSQSQSRRLKDAYKPTDMAQ